MNGFEWLVRRRADERRSRSLERIGDRSRYVTFDEWHQIEHPETHGRWDALTKTQRNKLYREYQERMIEMGFAEWQRARTIPGVSPCIDLFD